MITILMIPAMLMITIMTMMICIGSAVAHTILLQMYEFISEYNFKLSSRAKIFEQPSTFAVGLKDCGSDSNREIQL